MRDRLLSEVPRRWDDFEKLRARKLARHRIDVEQRETFTRDLPRAILAALDAPPERVAVRIQRGTYAAELSVRLELLDENGEAFTTAYATVEHYDGRMLAHHREGDCRHRFSDVPVEAPGYEALVEKLLSDAYASVASSPFECVFPEPRKKAPNPTAF